MVEPLTMNFRVFTVRLVDVQKLRNFTIYMCINEGGRTGLVVRASDSRSGDPGSILGWVDVLFP